jgi:hypothetical protein
MLWWKRREVWLGASAVILVAVLYNQVSALLLPSLPPDLLAPAAGGGKTGRDLAADAVAEVRLEALGAARSTYDPRGRNLFQYGSRTPPPPPPPTPEQLQLAEQARRLEEEAQRQRATAILEERRRQEAERQAQAAAMQPQPQSAEPPPGVQRASAPSGPVPPEPSYRLVGYMGKADDKIAVLMEEGEVVLVKEGEGLGKDFVVRRIRAEWIELGYTDPRFKDEKRTLPMGSN